MFNVGGGELLIILFVALVVLGPDKLPDAARKIGNVMGEVRRMSAGFQDEVRSAMDTPTRIVNETIATPPAAAVDADQPVGDAMPLDAMPLDAVPPDAGPDGPPVPRRLERVADDDDLRPVDPTGDAPTRGTPVRRSDDPAA